MSTHIIQTNVGSALVKALVYHNGALPRFASTIYEAWQRGKHNIVRQDVTVNVSYKTRKQLIKEGILV